MLISDDCGLIKMQLLDYARDRLSPSERTVVAQHLNTCDACRQEAVAVAETMAILRRELPMTDAPLSLRDKILASVNAAPRAQIRDDPHYRALALPFREQLHNSFKRSPYFAISLFLHGAAAVLVVALLWQLREKNSPAPVINPPPEIVTERPIIPVSKATERFREREMRPAIITRGARLADGAVRVSIAQFFENADLKLSRAAEGGWLKALAAPDAPGTLCSVQQAQLVIPAELAAIFGTDLLLRIIEMDDGLEIWPQSEWQALLAQSPRSPIIRLLASR